MRAPTGEVRIGHVLDVLRQIPSDTIHTCVASPPYFGLRSYTVAEVIWDADPFCEHAWSDLVPGSARGGSGPGGKNGKGEGYARAAERGCSCIRCGAWCGTLGLEPAVELYVQHIVAIFREVRRVLRKDGTLWLNLGDSYANDGKWGGHTGGKHAAALHDSPIGRNKRYTGLKPKDLIGIPWRVALALQADGWYLRSDIIWSKANCMPSSVKDRPSCSHEYIFLLSKSAHYYYDPIAVREKAVNGDPNAPRGSRGVLGDLNAGRRSDKQGEVGNRTYTGFNARWDTARKRACLITGHPEGVQYRNRRSVWNINTVGFPESHFAVFPPRLPQLCILAGTSEAGCCAACGKPWARIVSKSRSFQSRSGKSGRLPEGKNGLGLQGGGETLDVRRGPVVDVETLGWRKSCKCETSEVVPCLVLDPFCGSGTTGVVAIQNGRDFLGIDLGYEEMSRKRIEGASLPITGLLAACDG